MKRIIFFLTVILVGCSGNDNSDETVYQYNSDILAGTIDETVYYNLEFTPIDPQFMKQDYIIQTLILSSGSCHICSTSATFSRSFSDTSLVGCDDCIKYLETKRLNKLRDEYYGL